MNYNYGYQGGNVYQQPPQPVFKQYAVGNGIDRNEYNAIYNSAVKAVQNRIMPYSTNTSQMIKQTIGGEWFVFVSPVGSKDYDFCLSSVTGGDFMSFSLDNTLFQVCRIR